MSNVSQTITVEQTVETSIDVSLYAIEDSQCNDVDWSRFEIDSDNDIIITIKGVVITEEQKRLLDRAEELTQDDWYLIATQHLIDL